MNSERLIFNHYTTVDFDDYYKLVSNADVMKMITGRPLLEEETRIRFELMLKINKEFPEIGHFKITLKSNGSFIGHSKLEMVDGREAEIGYVIMPEYWRMGLGNEIAQALVILGKRLSEIVNLLAIIAPENIASKRILENQDFRWDHDGDYKGLPAAYYKLKL